MATLQMDSGVDDGCELMALMKIGVFGTVVARNVVYD